jgi:cytoskeletal protein CcmA (bactofilin family)
VQFLQEVSCNPLNVPAPHNVQAVAATANFSTARVLNSATSTSTNTGALQVVGGVGIAGNMYIAGLITGLITTATNLPNGATGSIPYQSTAGSTTMLPIGNALDLLVSNGDTPYWTNANALLSNTTTNAANIFVNTATTTYYINMSPIIGDFTTVWASPTLAYDAVSDQLQVASTTSSTSTTTGALVINGGVGIQGAIYSRDGQEFEGNLLYTPRITISPTPPADPVPRVGDFWIDNTTGYELQYVQDGEQRIWIQFTGL